jgi:hypothetical protein
MAAALSQPAVLYKIHGIHEVFRCNHVTVPFTERGLENMNPDLQKALDAAAAGNQGPGVGTYIVAILFAVLMIAAMWRIFTKAGKPGWASIIPIYNAIVLLSIAGKPAWWFILFFIPVVNFIIAIFVYVALAERFGKGAGFAAGLVLLGPIFFPILGFGSAQYRGAPAVAKVAA